MRNALLLLGILVAGFALYGIARADDPDTTYSTCDNPIDNHCSGGESDQGPECGSIPPNPLGGQCGGGEGCAPATNGTYVDPLCISVNVTVPPPSGCTSQNG